MQQRLAYQPLHATERVRLHGRHPQQHRGDRPGGGTVQEHPQGILPQLQRTGTEKRRHSGRGGQSRSRHRHRNPDRHTGRTAGEEGQPEERGGDKARVSPGEGGRHGEVRASQSPRTPDYDRVAPDCQGPRVGDEDRRRGVSGRRQQGHLLLHSRRTRGLPPTD